MRSKSARPSRAAGRIATILAGLALVVVSAHALWTGGAPKPSLADALRSDAASGYRWCDLGEEFMASGHAGKARYCMARATQLAPAIPPVWVRAANLHFQLGEPEQAMRYSARVLDLVPDYDAVLFGYYDLLVQDTRSILAALAPNPRALQSYLRHLMLTNQLAPAQMAWSRLAGSAALAPNPRALQSYLPASDAHQSACPRPTGLVPAWPAQPPSLPTPAPYSPTRRHLMLTNQLAPAQMAWSRLSGAAAIDPLAAEYLDFLVRNGKRREAADAWLAYAGPRSPGYGASNRLFNGGFELQPARSIFDWAILPLEGAETTRDSSQAQAGRWSLRIQFKGQANLDYQHVAQAAYLAPGAYRLSAYIKTGEITTDQGIRLRVFDRDAPQRLDTSTEQFTGTHGWTLVQKSFTVSPPTNLVVIQVCRGVSQKFDNKINGTVWVDTFSLTPVP